MFFVFRDFYVLCIYVRNILCTFHTYPYIWLCNILLFSNFSGLEQDQCRAPSEDRISQLQIYKFIMVSHKVKTTNSEAPVLEL